MSEAVMWILIGWVPPWLLALMLGAPRRPARWLAGGCFAAFIAGVATAEMRRHGLLVHHLGEPYVPAIGLYLHEIVRFFMIGASGALAGDWVQDFWSNVRRRAAAGGGGSPFSDQ